MAEMNEFTPDLYTLEDDDGNETTFQLLDQMELNGVTYYAMIPADSLEGDGNLLVLKEDVLSDEEGMLVTIDDEEEFNTVGNMFLDRLGYSDDDDNNDDNSENSYDE